MHTSTRIALNTIPAIPAYCVMALALALMAPLTCQAAQPAPSTGDLPVVALVDLQRYAGTWYEQARLPNFFQRMCTGQVAASYALLAGGGVGVDNRCAQSDGTTAKIRGIARSVPVEGKPGAGRLEVSFVPTWLRWIPLVWGDYWVMQLDDDYQAALEFAKASGFDVGAVVRTPALPAVSVSP